MCGLLTGYYITMFPQKDANNFRLFRYAQIRDPLYSIHVLACITFIFRVRSLMTMNNKGCGRKRSWPNLRYYPEIFLKGLRKTTINIRRVGVPAEIRMGYLPNTSQKSYRLSQLNH
jgi:hypothetical protein